MTEKGLQMEINLPKELRGQGLGPTFFETAIKESGAMKFTAKWVKNDVIYPETGESVNLTQYNYWVNEAKLSPDQAAFKTWTGIQAEKNGFTNVTVTKIEGGIEATFTK